MDDVKNPVLGYADSYRAMARDAANQQKPKEVSMWSVVTDLERNIAPLWEAQRLRADTAEAERDQHKENLLKCCEHAGHLEDELVTQKFALRDVTESLERFMNRFGCGEPRDLKALETARAALNPKPGGHYSDCATNNRGVPELLGPCDCGYEGDAK